jgi:hypothetical protein
LIHSGGRERDGFTTKNAKTRRVWIFERGFLAPRHAHGFRWFIPDAPGKGWIYHEEREDTKGLVFSFLAARFIPDSQRLARRTAQKGGGPLPHQKTLRVFAFFVVKIALPPTRRYGLNV